MSKKSLQRIAAELRMLDAQSEMIAIDYEGVDLGADLPLEDQAEVIARLADIDYWISKLDREERM